MEVYLSIWQEIGYFQDFTFSPFRVMLHRQNWVNLETEKPETANQQVEFHSDNEFLKKQPGAEVSYVIFVWLLTFYVSFCW